MIIVRAPIGPYLPTKLQGIRCRGSCLGHDFNGTVPEVDADDRGPATVLTCLFPPSMVQRFTSPFSPPLHKAGLSAFSPLLENGRFPPGGHK